MDGMKVALSHRRNTVEVMRKIEESGEPWCICNGMSFMLPILLDPVFFWTARQCFGGYHLERNEMPLHDAVRVI